MSFRMIGLLAATATLAAACSPGPGSPEWCKAVIEGKATPNDAEIAAHEEKCSAVIMQEVMKGLQRQ